MTKYLRSVTPDGASIETVYARDDSKLTCISYGVEISFNLSDIIEIKEDELFLEINFGERGLCTIPLRVFGNETKKAQFIQELETNHTSESHANNKRLLESVDSLRKGEGRERKLIE